MQSENLKNFLKLVSETKESTIHEKMAWRKENKEWLRKSAKIALKVLGVMREKQITQKDLADLLQVAPQRVHTILKGEENFTLDTIVKLEKALQIEIIEVVKVPICEVIISEIIVAEAEIFEVVKSTVKKSKKQKTDYVLAT